MKILFVMILGIFFIVPESKSSCIWCFNTIEGNCSTRGGYGSGYNSCTCAGTCSCSGNCGARGAEPIEFTKMLNLNSIDSEIYLQNTTYIINLTDHEIEYMHNLSRHGSLNDQIETNSLLLQHIGLYKIDHNQYLLMPLKQGKMYISDCFGKEVMLS